MMEGVWMLWKFGTIRDLYRDLRDDKVHFSYA